jgi:hypothetical protein
MILKVSGAASERFKSLYTPLIPRLRDLLRKENVSICSPPFAELLQLLIGNYLHDVLGAKPRKLTAKIRKIGCGCNDCQEVDRFLTSSTTAQQVFRYAQARRLHVERQLSAAPDLVTFQTIRSGNPHGVMVTKRPEIVEASQWISKVSEAKVFLNSIGDDAVIAKLMGNRHADVMKALQGTQRFILTMSDAAISSSRCAVAASSTETALRVSSLSAPAGGTVASAPTTGKKRKKSALVSLGPVIDLTGGDSP